MTFRTLNRLHNNLPKNKSGKNYKISKELHDKMRGNAINIKEDTNITLTRLGRKKNLISKTKCNE